MSFSIENVYNIFLKHVCHEKIESYFLNFGLEKICSISKPKIMQGFMGIDSPLSYFILLEAINFAKDKKIHYPRNFTKEEIESIYKDVYAEYKKQVELNYKWIKDFIPDLFFFEKRLKEKKLFE